MNKIISYAPRYSVNEKGEVFGYYGKLKPREVGYQGNGSSYLQVVLNVDGKKIPKYVHVLVAEAFMIDYNLGDYQVNHKDGNKANNHISNLELTTASENMKHAVKKGLVTCGYVNVLNKGNVSKRLTKTQLEKCNDYPEREYTQASGSAWYL